MTGSDNPSSREPSAPSFVLEGIWGVYNFGCEAIIRGTADILKSRWPDCTIRYVSRRPAQDAQALRECPVEVVHHYLSRLHPRRILNAARRRLGWPSRLGLYHDLRWYRSNDILLSIGGDIFTLPSLPYPSQATEESIGLDFQREILSRVRHYVLWAASAGPFEDWPQALPLYRNFLQEIDLITVREPHTLDYLSRLGVSTDRVNVADPAFLLRPVRPEVDLTFLKRRKPLIGLNLSPLSTSRALGEQDFSAGAAVQQQADLVAQIVTRIKADVVLVPHVVIPHVRDDDDYGYLGSIYDRVPAGCKANVSLLSPTLGARETKWVVGNLDALITARMHCGIAGVSSGTPTIFVAYSRKAFGMAEYVYGRTTMCMPLEALCSTQGLELIQQTLHSRDQLRKELNRKSSSFVEQAHAGAEAIAHL